MNIDLFHIPHLTFVFGYQYRSFLYIFNRGVEIACLESTSFESRLMRRVSLKANFAATYSVLQMLIAIEGFLFEAQTTSERYE